MARFNTALTSSIISGTATIGTPYSGAFTEFTGTAPYTVTLPSPTLFPGVNQTFYNATSGQVTLSVSGATFSGTGGTGSATFVLNAGNVVSIFSDGTNYIVISEDGSPLTATTGSFSGNVTINGGTATLSVTNQTVTINPTGTSTIDNVNIGTTTRGSGAFNTLTANQAVTFTANTASSGTGTGSLVVTGGVGVSGNINSGATVTGVNLAGTISTAAQPNITSVGTLTALTVSGATNLATSSGNVGIGTTNTYNLKTVIAGAGAASSTGSGSYLVASLADTTAMAQDVGGGLGFQGNDGVNGLVTFASINGSKENATSGNYASYLSFKTRVNSGNLTERIRIDSSGNVGIGTTSPAQKLDVRGYIVSDVNSNAVEGGFYLGNSGHGIRRAVATNDVYVYTSGGTLYLTANGSTSTQVAILNSGNVGIGTTSPGATLDMGSRTDAIILPVGTSAQRPTGVNGMMRKNSSTGYVEYWDPTANAWLGIGQFSASGGTQTSVSGDNVHTFLTSGTFTVAAGAKAVTILLVAGGGGGGNGNPSADGNGGGGAGGVIYSVSTITMTPGAYSVTVGAGGPGGISISSNIASRGTSGTNSVFSTLTAIGGGGGGSDSGAALSGGSGGGTSTSGSGGSGGTGTAGQGSNGGGGGTGGAGPGGGGGGGGGADAVGGINGQNTIGGAGGIGRPININGTNYYWAGGGGASSWTNAGGTGGLGGGGGGGSRVTSAGGSGGSALNSGVAGSGSSGGAAGVNTGGGGGAGTAGGSAGLGGSGIVIIRYTP